MHDQKGSAVIAIVIGVTVIIAIAGYILVQPTTVPPSSSPQKQLIENAHESKQQSTSSQPAEMRVPMPPEPNQPTTEQTPTPSDDTEPTIPAQQTHTSQEDIRSCIPGGNSSRTFYVVFSAETSREDAEHILKTNNAETTDFKERSRGFAFELPPEDLCESIERIFNMKGVFAIPSLKRKLDDETPMRNPVNSLSCPSVSPYFVRSDGYTTNYSNNFTLAYYQNGDLLDESLQSIGAYNIVATGSRPKTFYATFENGKICSSVQTLEAHPQVVQVGNVPWMPTIPPQ